MHVVKSGRESSEYQRSLRAEIAGGVILAIGVVLAILGRDVAGVGLAAVGGYILAHAIGTYTSSRGAVKAASHMPTVPTAVKGARL